VRHFLFIKNIWDKLARTYFHFYKKGLLNSQAVSIWVTGFLTFCFVVQQERSGDFIARTTRILQFSSEMQQT
jgi:hypothetical protein